MGFTETDQGRPLTISLW